MIATIQAALAPLCGLPVYNIGRAAGMLWVQFGTPRRVPSRLDLERVLGEYALHLQCPWRVSGATGVLTGSSDLFVPADPMADEGMFRWDKPGDAVVDLLVRRWVSAHAAKPLVVERVSVDRCGGFALSLSQEFAIEVFPDASAEPHDVREQWRLFRTEGDDERHFVWLNHGIE
jgi:hypothetical protein